jgi:hypothetical protein
VSAVSVILAAIVISPPVRSNKIVDVLPVWLIVVAVTALLNVVTATALSIRATP